MTQMIDCSLSKPKPLSSIPSMAKKKKKWRFCYWLH
jgi:hypothetical protein